VLKDPSAFLYGRSDPGSTFHIVTKQPFYGSYGRTRSQAVSQDAFNRHRCRAGSPRKIAYLFGGCVCPDS
jgi:hypothetical protein